MNDSLGSSRKGSGLGPEWIDRADRGGQLAAGLVGGPNLETGQPSLRQQASQGHGAETHARAAEQLAAGQHGIVQARFMVRHGGRPRSEIQ